MVVLPVGLLWASRSPRSAVGGQRSGSMRIAEVPAGERSPTLRVVRRWARRRFGTVPAPLVPLGHHPRLLRGSVAMELALDRSQEVDARLKDLAMTKVALMVRCEWCIDFGSALLQRHGLDEQTIRELPGWRESSAFAPLERLGSSTRRS